MYRHAFFTIANAKKTTATRAGASRASSGKDARATFFEDSGNKVPPVHELGPSWGE